jgi:asparagine N-glycosylation enzyme membrane subunit Stt3
VNETAAPVVAAAADHREARLERRGDATPQRRWRALLLAALLLALLLRIGTAPEVFAGGRVDLDGTDGYYHLRRALLTLVDWPQPPQRDAFLGPPMGGLVQWGPLFDLMLAALARPYPGPPTVALEAVGARLPVLLGLAQVLAVAVLARRLGGAAAVAALLAAALPAVVRFTLLGALDHDPFIELLMLLVLVALAGRIGRAREPLRRLLPPALLATAGLAALPLTWAGCVLHFGLLAAALVGALVAGGRRAAAPPALLLAAAAAAAAAVVAPFAAASPWSRIGESAFAGLSWLHVAALALLAVGAAVMALAGGAVLSRAERAAAFVAGGLGALIAAVLLPRVVASFLAGFHFALRDNAFVAATAESRPLLFLFGGFDARPALVRLSALPLLLPLLLPVPAARRFARTRSNAGTLPVDAPAATGRGLVLGWSAAALALALLQARYSHAAAVAVAVLGGVAWARVRRRQRVAMGLALLPCLAAYLPLPGFAGLRLYGRPADVVTSGMAEATAFLAATGPPPPAWLDATGEAHDAVLAPWSAGHWIHWRARRPAVANPFGRPGQTASADGVRFWLLTDDRQAVDLLRRHRVRWVVAPTSPQPPWELAALAGEDPRPWRLDQPGAQERFLRSTGARLAWSPHVPFLREVYRTRASRRSADGSLEPLLRVYEVMPAAARLTKPPDAPTTSTTDTPPPPVTAPRRAPSGP